MATLKVCNLVGKLLCQNCTFWIVNYRWSQYTRNDQKFRHHKWKRPLYLHVWELGSHYRWTVSNQQLLTSLIRDIPALNTRGSTCNAKVAWLIRSINTLFVNIELNSANTHLVIREKHLSSEYSLIHTEFLILNYSHLLSVQLRLLNSAQKKIQIRAHSHWAKATISFDRWCDSVHIGHWIC